MKNKSIKKRSLKKVRNKKGGGMILMKKNKKTKNILIKYWDGDFSLAKTFWIGGVLIGSIVALPSVLIDDGTITASSDGITVLIAIYTILFNFFLVYIYIGMWRSSSKYIAQKKKIKRSSFWGYAVYVSVVLGFFDIVMGLLIPLLT